MQTKPGGWTTGWAAGAGVVVVAAGLLLELTRRGNRIAAQAREVTESLERARDRTAPLFELSETAATVDRSTRLLRSLRETGG